MNGNLYKNKLLCLAIFATALLLALPAQAQNTALSGKVMDQAGGVIPGVTVTLTSQTGVDRSEVTDGVGSFHFPQLAPGKYRVKAELAGFKTAVKEGLELLVDTPMTLELKLEVGQISETVTVEAGAVRLNTQDASMGTAFEAVRITQLPLESRNVAGLLSLQAAVTPDGYVSGSRSDQSNLTLDGVDVNEQQTGEAFSTVLRITPDSVQEFRVTTNTPTANQGRSAGGQVSLITKTGTNEWHGSLYEFHRNTVTTANDFFNNRSGVDRPKLIRNLFGGSVGGPIKKDRAFFFYNYEGRRDAKETTVLQTVPLPVLGAGQVKYDSLSAGGVKTMTTAEINALYPAQVNPAATKVLGAAAARYKANNFEVGDGLNTAGFRFNAPLPVAQNSHTATLNFNLTRDAKHVLLLRGNYQHDHEAGAPAWPDTPGTGRWSHPTGVMAQETWTVTNNLVNTFRFGLTRQAFTQQGDSSENQLYFRYVYWPKDFTRSLNRVTPVYNFVDDLAWVKGNHTFGFGTNIRLIRNERVSYSKAYDVAYANPTYYEDSGAVLTAPIIDDINGSEGGVRDALCAVIGRFSSYSANFNFNRDGSIMKSGTGVGRTWATEEYEFYIQDAWRVRPDLTLSLGLRYSLNRPVYEANGFEVKPTTSLSDYFDKRVASAAQGKPYNETISVDISGPVNGKGPLYNFKKNDFSPRAAFAWQPTFENRFLKMVFGEGKKSVIRGGFAMMYDHIGSQLAVSFDNLNTLGFSSTQSISANAYNVTDSLAPLYTGPGQDIRSFPGISVPSKLTFPLTTPADGEQRIESSLDDKLTSPRNYSWNFSIGRELGHGFTLEASYVGRSARNLLAQRDVMQLNNLKDPKSGMDWYTAANLFFDARWNNVPISKMPVIPYFENLFPDYRRKGLPNATQSAYSRVSRDGSDLPDWTYLQAVLDYNGIYPYMFFQPQYAALSVWSTMAYSDYHAGTLTLRERFKSSLNFDLNYTFSKSTDNASGLQTSSSYGSAFIENALRPDDNHAVSDFDLTHMINANAMWDIPIGRGKTFLNTSNKGLDAVIGGWQMTGIFRWNSGLPDSAPWDLGIWATNWNAQSWGSLIRPLKANPHKSGETPNFYTDATYAYQSFRNARPGETGERNNFRIPSYVSIDLGLGKTWKMPYNEGHRVQFRWEVFNMTNTQRLSGPNRDFLSLDIDPQLNKPSSSFGNITSIQGNPRVMQFALRYDF